MSLSLEAYKAELQRWSDQVGALNGDAMAARKLRSALPSKWVIAEERCQFESGTQWLNAALDSFVTAKPEQRRETVERIQARLTLMQAQADEYRQPQPTTGARGRLQDILSRREFHAVTGPSFWDVLLRKLDLWLDRLLSKLFRKVPSDLQLGQILVWLAIALGSAVLVIWLRRKAMRASEERRREPVPFAPSARNWRQWLTDARTAAAHGDWRDAIRLAYWAGVSHLEESGAWVPDRARTPREYLRLLGGQSEKRPPLTALTRKFELVWYGSREAADADFHEAVSQLELLGCR